MEHFAPLLQGDDYVQDDLQEVGGRASTHSCRHGM